MNRAKPGDTRSCANMSISSYLRSYRAAGLVPDVPIRNLLGEIHWFGPINPIVIAIASATMAAPAKITAPINIAFILGVIAGLIAQGLPTNLAAAVGVHLHGLAGDLCAEQIAPVGFLASDVADAIPSARDRLEECYED